MVIKPNATIIDVLENALEGDLTDSHIDALDKVELANLADRINEFYDAWDLPEPDKPELRMYSGGWVAGNTLAQDQTDYMLNTLLYYPSPVIHDDLAEWFDPYRTKLIHPPSARNSTGHLKFSVGEPVQLTGAGYYALIDDLDRTRLQLKMILPKLLELAPLIRQGVVIPVPMVKIIKEHEADILAGVKFDVSSDDFVRRVENPIDMPPPSGDHIRGLSPSPDAGWATGHKNRGVGTAPSYFLNKTLAVADAAKARYIPPAATDANLYDYKVEQLEGQLRRRNIHTKTVSALQAANLPFFTGLTVSQIADIRRNADDFEDWRVGLSQIVGQIECSTADGDNFIEEAQQVLSDGMQPLAKQAREQVSRSRYLAKITKDTMVDVLIGGISAYGTAPLLHQPVTEAALAVAGIQGALGWTYRALFRPTPTGRRAVMARLIRK